MAEKTKADITKLYVGSDKTPFNFKAIDVNEGARLLAALPPESQRRVSAIAEAFGKIDMPLAEELPEELRDPTKLVAFFADATKIAKGEVQGISESSKALYRRMKMGDPDMAAVGSLFEGFEVFKAVRSVGGFAADVGSEYLDMLRYAYRKPMSMITNAKENGSQLRERPTKDQILALAAVDEAVMKRLVRTEEVEPPAPTIEPNWLDQAFARANQGWNFLTTSSFGKYIRAFGYAVMDMIGGKGFDLARSLAEVEKVILAEGPQKTYQELLDDQLASRRDVQKQERPVILTLSDIDEVAGLKAAPLFKMIEQDTPVATRDGKVAILKKGGTQVEDVPHNGRPLEMATLQQHRENQTTGSIGEHGEGIYQTVVTGTAGLLAARTGVSVVGNVVNQRAVAPAVTAAIEYRKTVENAKSVAERLAKAEAGKGVLGTSIGVEDVAKVKSELTAAQEKLSTAQTKLNQLGVSTSAVMDGDNLRPKADIEARVKEERLGHMKNEGGLSKLGAKAVEHHQAPRHIANPSRWVGGFGHMIGSVGNTAYNATAGVVKAVVVRPALVAGNYVLDTVEGAKNLARNATDAIVGKVEVKSGPHWFDGRASARPSSSVAEHVVTPETHAPKSRFSFRKGLGITALFGAIFGAKEAAAKTGESPSIAGGALAGGASAVDSALGVSDLAAGDKKGFLLSLVETFTPMPARTFLDVDRIERETKALPATQIGSLTSLLAANSTRTGNEYLDRIIMLKQWQKEGVKEVALAALDPAKSYSNLGEVAHKGKGETPLLAPEMAEKTVTIEEAINTNMRLYVVINGGGDIAKAEALLKQAAAKATGTVPADPALHDAGVKATLSAEQARVAAVAAQSADAMAKARAAANRGLAFANVRSAEPVGVVRLQEGLPMSANVSADMLSSVVGA